MSTPLTLALIALVIGLPVYMGWIWILVSVLLQFRRFRRRREAIVDQMARDLEAMGPSAFRPTHILPTTEENTK